MPEPRARLPFVGIGPQCALTTSSPLTSLTPPPPPRSWNQIFTVVQLRFDFLAESAVGAYGAVGLPALIPVTLSRTYFTFYDLDTGEPQVRAACTSYLWMRWPHFASHPMSMLWSMTATSIAAMAVDAICACLRLRRQSPFLNHLTPPPYTPLSRTVCGLQHAD